MYITLPIVECEEKDEGLFLYYLLVPNPDNTIFYCCMGVHNIYILGTLRIKFHNVVH